MKTRDLLFIETDDTCALCGEKERRALNIHHIDGDSSNNAYDNQIVLCHNCHTRHHNQKGVPKTAVADRKRHLIAKTVTQYGINAMKIASRNNFGVIAMPFLLYHLVDLGYMEQLEVQMGYGEQADATARFSITEEGSRVLIKWLA